MSRMDALLVLANTPAADDLPTDSEEWRLRLVVASRSPGVAEMAWNTIRRVTFNDWYREAKGITCGWPTVGHLRAATDDELLAVPQLGRACLATIRRASEHCRR